MLQQLPAKRTDWIYLIDYRIQIGHHRYFLILGVPQQDLEQQGYDLCHQEMHLLDIYISPEPPEVVEQIQRFDAEFNSILQHLNLDIYQAKNRVIDWLEKKIRETER